MAARNAFLIDRMLEAGAISLGKNNLHAFAYGATGENTTYGTAVNAYDPSRLAGGSSSGSAAALAFGLTPAAFGTDTGGSIRAPAALSGLVGLKPTMGRVSSRGIMPYCWTLDHVGLLTRSVTDAGLLLRTVAGFDPEDPTLKLVLENANVIQPGDLLHVRGFDIQENRFQYAVNSRFGKSIQTQAAPFRLTLTARIDLADPIPIQQARDLLSVRVRGRREPAPTNVIQQRLRNEYQFTTPYYGVLARLDSLALSDQQYQAIRNADIRYSEVTDSLFGAFVVELRQVEKNGGQLVARKAHQQRTYRDLHARELRQIYKVLRPEQLQKLNETLRVEILRAVDEDERGR